MTDFIHEHPKNDPPETPVTPEEEAPLDEKTGQKRVYGYILILFVVAFALLVWSFLMNQRSNEQVLSELRGSAGTLQSTLDRNIELEQRAAELEEAARVLEQRVAELEETGARLESEKAELESQRDALQQELEHAQAEIEALKAAAEASDEQ